MFSGWYFVGNWGGDNNFTQETAMAMFSPSAHLPLFKGNKSGSSPAVGAALELVVLLALGCHSKPPEDFGPDLGAPEKDTVFLGGVSTRKPSMVGFSKVLRVFQESKDYFVGGGGFKAW
eukprot:FR738851.1.p4 GENE.FR738851.1~~FR738851.1.p4  ORF type:complete len:119 (-),score=24.39 FR738851.1:390-746(-)